MCTKPQEVADFFKFTKYNLNEKYHLLPIAKYLLVFKILRYSKESSCFSILDVETKLKLKR